MEITTSRKLVSIGLPTYCGEKRISRALDSLCAQTYPEIEIIISDNASDDATATICQAYARRDPRIRFFQQKENIGRIDNFLLVLSHAHGDYFMWAGDDDTWDTRFIETLVTGLDGNPKHGVALSSFRRERGDEKTSEFVLFAGTQSLTHLPYKEVFKKMLMHEPIHIFFSGLWRTDIVRKLFSRRVPATVAWDRIMMAEAALMTHFYSADAVLFYKYANPVSIKSRHAKDPEQNRNKALFAYNRYLFTLLARIITSPFIPAERKFVVPAQWCGAIWARRKRIVGVTLRDVRRLMIR